MQISATDLNRSPAKYVELAEAGETIDIVRRGEVVARLAPAGTPAQNAHNPDGPRTNALDIPIKEVARDPVDPPFKKSANPRTQGRPEPKVSQIEGLKPGERYETKEERVERMDRMRAEMGIKDQPSTWETKYGRGKQP